MGAHVFSPSLLGFYAKTMYARYVAAGSWPPDPVDITDEVWGQYAGASPPPGQMLGSNSAGQPAWVDLPPPPPPTQAQLAMAMLATGFAVVSTASPELSATYPCDQNTTTTDANLLGALTAGLELPNNVAIRPDVQGVAHAFPPADYKNYCQAKLTFMQTLSTIIANNQGALPVQPTVIP